MTAPLAGALVLSVLTGVTVSWFFIAWPRRISAEEWIVRDVDAMRQPEVGGQQRRHGGQRLTEVLAVSVEQGQFQGTTGSIAPTAAVVARYRR